MSEATAFGVRQDLDTSRPRARYSWGMRIAPPIVAVASSAFLAPAALAQFDSPPTPASEVRSRIVGEVTSESGAPTLDSGDEIAAIFNNTVVGLQQFGGGESPAALNLVVFGDDPETPEQEGPPNGAQITFRFFDQSTGMIRNNVVALNSAGEVSIVRFQGDRIDIDVPLPPDLLIPVQEFDLRLTAEDGSPGDGGGGGGGGGSAQGDPDVNGDGTIDKRDVALVLRAVIGANRRLTDTQRARADVNGDGVVTTADAIEIIRQQ